MKNFLISTYYIIADLLYSELEIKPYVFGSRIEDMEAESHSWSHFLKQKWYCGMNRMLSKKCQSVHWDMMFLASNSLHNLRGQKWSCPYHHPRHLQQTYWSKLLCGMYGLTAKSDVPLFVKYWWDWIRKVQKWKVINNFNNLQKICKFGKKE